MLYIRYSVKKLRSRDTKDLFKFSYHTMLPLTMPYYIPLSSTIILLSIDHKHSLGPFMLQSCTLGHKRRKTELERQAYIQTFCRLTFFFPVQGIYLKTAYLPEFALLAKILYQTATFYCCCTSWITALFDGKWDAPSCKLSINISELFNFLLIV